MDAYDIEYTDEAFDDLGWFKKHEQREVLDGINQNLQHEPEKLTRNRFPMRPNQTADWELRIGRFRVFYDVDQAARLVLIVAIGRKEGNKVYIQGEGGEL